MPPPTVADRPFERDPPPRSGRAACPGVRRRVRPGPLAAWLLASVPVCTYLKSPTGPAPAWGALDLEAADCAQALVRLAGPPYFTPTTAWPRWPPITGVFTNYHDRLSAASCGLLDAIDRYQPGPRAGELRLFLRPTGSATVLGRHAQKSGLDRDVSDQSIPDQPADRPAAGRPPHEGLPAPSEARNPRGAQAGRRLPATGTSAGRRSSRSNVRWERRTKRSLWSTCFAIRRPNRPPVLDGGTLAEAAAGAAAHARGRRRRAVMLALHRGHRFPGGEAAEDYLAQLASRRGNGCGPGVFAVRPTPRRPAILIAPPGPGRGGTDRARQMSVEGAAARRFEWISFHGRRFAPVDLVAIRARKRASPLCAPHPGAGEAGGWMKSAGAKAGLLNAKIFQVSGGLQGPRGRNNAVFALAPGAAAAGVVTHSSGNHGAALTAGGPAPGIPAHIVVPQDAFALEGGVDPPVWRAPGILRAHPRRPGSDGRPGAGRNRRAPGASLRRSPG